METVQDKYPSRIEGIGQILPREDPVVYDEGPVQNGPLTPGQVSAYERDGYIFMESFYGRDEIATLLEETERLKLSEEVRQSELAITEPTSGETRSIFAVHTVSDLYSKLAADGRIVGIISQLLGSEVYLHQSRLNLKPGFRGKEFYWHSDFETWHCEDGMPNMRAISCSIALTDNHEFNGPLMIIPGSHKYFCQCSGLTPENHYQQSLKKQDFGVPNDEQLTWLADQGGIVAPKGPAGSVVLFECNLMHGSNGNITPYPRSNAFFVFNSMENPLEKPFAADYERPWFLGNREPDALQPVDFSAVVKQHSLQPA